MNDAFARDLRVPVGCDPPFSFYSLIEDLYARPSHQGREPNCRPIHRFCTLMRKLRAKSFIAEDLILNRELTDEKEMACKVCGEDATLRARRLTFFRVPPERLTWDKPAAAFEQHLLGYAIVVTLQLSKDHWRTYLLEAVVRPPSVVLMQEKGDTFMEPITNYYVHNMRTYETLIGTSGDHKRMSIRGSFFSQQNSLTSVCAHAALRMAVNSSPLLRVPKLTNRKINDILGVVDFRERGLSHEEIVAVLKDIECNWHTANFYQRTDIEYDHFLYPTLESGCPTILALENWDVKAGRRNQHVVAVLGHTLNSDRWWPEARTAYGSYPIREYISSAEWCDHYIISDDNFGMYLTLPTDSVRNFVVPSKNPAPHAVMAISIVPQAAPMPGYVAEQLAAWQAYALINSSAIESGPIWFRRLRDRPDMVCRTLLVTAEEYRESLRGLHTILSPAQQSCLAGLPPYVWVTEISLPDVYQGNKHKLGEVVIRADASPQEHVEGRSIALAWLPGLALIGPQQRIEPWPVTMHVPLIRNSAPSMLEW